MVTTLRKLLKVLSLAKRFKIRHFKLGFNGLMKLATYHLGEYLVQSKLNARVSKDRDWLVNDSTLTILLTVFNQSGQELENPNIQETIPPKIDANFILGLIKAVIGLILIYLGIKYLSSN